MIDFEMIDGPAVEKHGVIFDELAKQILARQNRFGNSEIKKLEIRHFEGCKESFAVIECGLIGDEGTAAAIFCRDYRHIQIKKNGGLVLLNAQRKRESLGMWHAVHSLVK